MSGAYLDWLEIFIREWTRDEEYEREVMHSWTNNGSKRSGEKKKPLERNSDREKFNSKNRKQPDTDNVGIWSR